MQGDAAEPDQDLHGLHPEHQERQAHEDEGRTRAADQGGTGEQHEALHPTAHKPEAKAMPARGEAGATSQGAGGRVEQNDQRGEEKILEPQVTKLEKVLYSFSMRRKVL